MSLSRLVVSVLGLGAAAVIAFHDAGASLQSQGKVPNAITGEGMVHIPEAVLFDDLPALDNEKSYVADSDTGLLTRADPELETEVRRLAEEVLIEEALSSGVVEQAKFNAQQFMLTFMQGLGFESVIFTDETPPTAEPFVQEVPKGYMLVTPTPQP